MRRHFATALAVLLALSAAEPAIAQGGPGACAPDPEKIAAWNGVWMAENLQPEINGRDVVNVNSAASEGVGAMKFMGFNAPLNAEARAMVMAALGPDKLNAGWGYPLMMSAPSPFKFVITPGETVIISQYREIRYVRTDGSDHPPEEEAWPTLWGDSIGCWDGDTLTIDTTAIKYTPEFAYISPPLSEHAHVAETIRMVSHDRLEADFTITDPERLTEPWIVHMVYFRHPVLTTLVHEGDVFENDRFTSGEGGLTISDPAAPPAGSAP